MKLRASAMSVKHSDVVKVLQKLSLYGPAVCAGGYIRDTLLGKPYKNVDIFLKGVLPRNLPAWVLTRKRSNVYRKPSCGTIASITTYDVFGLYEDECSNGPTTQIVCINADFSLEDYITQTFDFNLCKIWMTPDGNIHTCPQYLEDVVAKTCTFALDVAKFTPRDFLRTMDHGKRIAAKYPDFKMNYGNLYKKAIEDAVRLL